MRAKKKAWSRAAHQQLLHRRKLIRDRERRYQAMSDTGKRVAIIKDVLLLLESEQIKLKRGDWCVIPGVPKALDGRDYRDLREVLVEIDPSCTGCALGAIFYATVMRQNAITVGEAAYGPHVGGRLEIGWYALSQYLKTVFDYDQLRLIECAFEKGEGQVWPNSVSLYRAKWFGQNYRTNTARLKAICQNIIENKGDFVPPLSKGELAEIEAMEADKEEDRQKPSSAWHPKHGNF